MFLEPFQNESKVVHFNEYLAQKYANSMKEIMAITKGYVKGDERNMKKRISDTKE